MGYDPIAFLDALAIRDLTCSVCFDVGQFLWPEMVGPKRADLGPDLQSKNHLSAQIDRKSVV